MAMSISAVAAICATAPSITHGQNPQPGRGSGTSVPSNRPMKEDQRERKAEQKPDMRGAHGAEAYSSARAAWRCAGSEKTPR